MGGGRLHCGPSRRHGDNMSSQHFVKITASTATFAVPVPQTIKPMPNVQFMIKDISTKYFLTCQCSENPTTRKRPSLFVLVLPASAGSDPSALGHRTCALNLDGRTSGLAFQSTCSSVIGLMVEICSKSLVRAISKVLLITFS